jgi:hypothetical protein
VPIWSGWKRSEEIGDSLNNSRTTPWAMPQIGELFKLTPIPCPPNEKWGPALLPAPTAPSEGSAGVRDLVGLRSPVLRSWLTSSGVASSHDSVRRQKLDLSRPFLDRPSFRAFLPRRLGSCDRKINSSGASCQLVR